MLYEHRNWLPIDGIEEFDPASSTTVDANLPVF